MKKNLFSIWLLFLVILFSVNMQGQMTIGGKKAPESFSVLELLNKGGLRLPQMTTTERNAFAVSGNVLANGLTIFNKTTSCVEYWNGARWISLCEGTSQTTLSPAACLNIATDGTGCSQTFSITDPDCPNGPFTIAIVAGNEYATLHDVDNVNGSFGINFNENASVNTRSILVRVTSGCNGSYKDFLYAQNGVNCTSMSYPVPTISPSASSLTLCSGGATYLSVPSTTANLDKLIWTRNGIEVARGVSYYVATQKGKYNVSVGAVGCNTNVANERNVTESGTAASASISILSSNNGVICGTNSVKLTALGNSASTVWFHNGVEEKSGAVITLSGASDVGVWFAAIKSGSCYSLASNSITISKSATTGQVVLNAADALVNGQALSSFTAFCKDGSLDLSVANKKTGVTYTWYNGDIAIASNPFIIPSSQTTILLSLRGTDNTGAVCSAEVNSTEKQITTTGAPAQPNITGNNTLCDGTTDLTIVPQVAGSYTYTWYKGSVKMADTTPTITVNTPGEVYFATVTNSTGCSSSMATKVINANVSSLPVVSWVTKPATATFGAKVTLQTSIEFGPATAYTWTATNGATITGTGASVTIQMPASGTDGVVITIKVTAENSCGKSIELPLTITLNSACPTPVVTAQSALSQTITSGASAPVAVSVTGGVNPTFQWYSNTTASTTNGTAISGATTASYAYKPAGAGTSYVYCVVTNGCVGNLKATSPVFTVITQIDPDAIPAGTGSLSGKSCFDIAESNDGGSCGPLASRQATKTDFNLAAINTQTYTFTPVGTVSKVRFTYVESLSGAIVKTFTTNGNEAALNVSGTVTATLIYKSTLSSPTGSKGTGAAYGKTDASALSVALYVVYNNKADGTGTDVQVKLTAKIKDCACCGAMISPTVFRNFMCHNLGANQSLDPMVPAGGLFGDYYMWGKKDPSATTDANGAVAINNVDPKYVPANNNLWGVPKTALDPCPAGYRVPTSDEWQSVIDNNAMVGIGTGEQNEKNVTSGVKFGQFLMLPSAGTFGNSSFTNGRGSTGFAGYYSSATNQKTMYAKTLFNYGKPNVAPETSFLAWYGKTIRCISEN